MTDNDQFFVCFKFRKFCESEVRKELAMVVTLEVAVRFGGIVFDDESVARYLFFVCLLFWKLVLFFKLKV